MSYDVFAKAIASGLSQIRILDLIDIIVIAIIIYKLIVLTKETRAYQVLKGMGILFLCAVVCDLLQIQTLSWLLSSFLSSGLILAVVLFQPEFRRALEHIGRGNLFDKSVLNGFSQEDSTIVSELQLAITDLAKRRVGALIVIEQKTALGDIAATGTRIDGVISAPLVENIFEPNTPLHDGAMIIRDRQIIAAACILPLAENMSVARELGTRHRAALGISTVSDSITIVVSEETGVISYARDGKLVRYVDNRALKDLLETIFVRGGASPLALLKRRAKNEEKH
ncbi:MAG: diadenylate cyclase CdaA [Eubacteriales bacterium]|nr:diadenylate cyclase CdaA [Christensenellaceae bacterium]MDY4695402.1 diadenylate cyclase CdaA [Eubacteriales bacterium]